MHERCRWLAPPINPILHSAGSLYSACQERGRLLNTPTAAYFALKGFGVVTCPWKKGNSAVQQVHDLVRLREQSNPAVQKRALGLVQTVWSGANSFMNAFYAAAEGRASSGRNEPSEAKCFVQAFDEIKALANAPSPRDATAR